MSTSVIEVNNCIILYRVFMPRHFKKCGLLCYALRSKITLSVCPWAQMSVHSHHFVSALYLDHFFDGFSSSFVLELILGKSGLGL